MKMLTNLEIYNMAKSLNTEFGDGSLVLPVKINFFLQKNMSTLLELAREIEEARLVVAQRFGELTEDGSSYQIPEEKISEARGELEELLDASQEVNIHIFKLVDFDNLNLTMNQMTAIMPMIEEE